MDQDGTSDVSPDGTLFRTAQKGPLSPVPEQSVRRTEPTLRHATSSRQTRVSSWPCPTSRAELPASHPPFPPISMPKQVVPERSGPTAERSGRLKLPTSSRTQRILHPAEESSSVRQPLPHLLPLKAPSLTNVCIERPEWETGGAATLSRGDAICLMSRRTGGAPLGMELKLAAEFLCGRRFHRPEADEASPQKIYPLQPDVVLDIQVNPTMEEHDIDKGTSCTSLTYDISEFGATETIDDYPAIVTNRIQVEIEVTKKGPGDDGRLIVGSISSMADRIFESLLDPVAGSTARTAPLVTVEADIKKGLSASNLQADTGISQAASHATYTFSRHLTPSEASVLKDIADKEAKQRPSSESFPEAYKPLQMLSLESGGASVLAPPKTESQPTLQPPVTPYKVPKQAPKSDPAYIGKFLPLTKEALPYSRLQESPNKSSAWDTSHTGMHPFSWTTSNNESVSPRTRKLATGTSQIFSKLSSNLKTERSPRAHEVITKPTTPKESAFFKKESVEFKKPSTHATISALPSPPIADVLDAQPVDIRQPTTVVLREHHGDLVLRDNTQSVHVPPVSHGLKGTELRQAPKGSKESLRSLEPSSAKQALDQKKLLISMVPTKVASSNEPLASTVSKLPSAHPEVITSEKQPPPKKIEHIPPSATMPPPRLKQQSSTYSATQAALKQAKEPKQPERNISAASSSKGQIKATKSELNVTRKMDSNRPSSKQPKPAVEETATQKEKPLTVELEVPKLPSEEQVAKLAKISSSSTMSPATLASTIQSEEGGILKSAAAKQEEVSVKSEASPKDLINTELPAITRSQIQRTPSNTVTPDTDTRPLRASFTWKSVDALPFWSYYSPVSLGSSTSKGLIEFDGQVTDTDTRPLSASFTCKSVDSLPLWNYNGPVSLDSSTSKGLIEFDGQVTDVTKRFISLQEQQQQRAAIAKPQIAAPKKQLTAGILEGTNKETKGMKEVDNSGKELQKETVLLKDVLPARGRKHGEKQLEKDDKLKGKDKTRRKKDQKRDKHDKKELSKTGAPETAQKKTENDISSSQAPHDLHQADGKVSDSSKKNSLKATKKPSKTKLVSADETLLQEMVMLETDKARGELTKAEPSGKNPATLSNQKISLEMVTLKTDEAWGEMKQKEPGGKNPAMLSKEKRSEKSLNSKMPTEINGRVVSADETLLQEMVTLKRDEARGEIKKKEPGGKKPGTLSKQKRSEKSLKSKRPKETNGREKKTHSKKSDDKKISKTAKKIEKGRASEEGSLPEISTLKTGDVWGEADNTKRGKESTQIKSKGKEDEIKEKGKDMEGEKSARDKILEKKRGAPAVAFFSKGGISWFTVCCLMFALVLSISLIVFIVYLLTTVCVTPKTPISTATPLPHPPLQGYYCETDFCNSEAAYISSLLSETKKPCENFYNYVCESWSTNNPLPRPSGAGDVLSRDTMLQESLIEKLMPLLHSMTEEGVKVAASLSNTCADRTNNKAMDSAREIFYGWSIKSWPQLISFKSSDVWLFAGELVRDLNVAALSDVAVGVNPRNLDKTAIVLDRPKPIFSYNDASRGEVTNLFRKALKETMSIFAPSANDIKDEHVIEVMNVFVRLGSAPAIPAAPDVDSSRYGTVKLIDLDSGIRDLLSKVFSGTVQIDLDMEVVLKSSEFVRNFLVSAVNQLPARALANYIGFLALVRTAPFFPDNLPDLRQLFGRSILGRTPPDVANYNQLCLLAVEKLLPDCFVKGSAILLKTLGADATIRQWLFQLETVFSRNLPWISWINDLSALIVRYRLKLRPVMRFGPNLERCAPVGPMHQFSTDNPLKFFHEVSMMKQQEHLQRVLNGSTGLPKRPLLSDLSTRATYDETRQLVHVPMALFNTSVPSNSTMFAFHLSRYGVRLYRALVELLFQNNVYEMEAPLSFTETQARKLDYLVRCFEQDLLQWPHSLKGSVTPNAATSRGALLLHTTAVQLAFRAFQELLPPRRIWGVDFRLKRLPDFSANKLFFVYYALDNCESADVVYKEHLGDWLPAEYRVNMPLRHLNEFGEVFGCAKDSIMMNVASGKCSVLTS